MTGPSASEPSLPSGRPEVSSGTALLRLRAVHRAAAELRRGTPVLLAGEAPLALLAAETASIQGIAELTGLAIETPVLLLAPTRTAAVLHRPVEPASEPAALRLAPALLTPDALHALADPTLDQTRSGLPEQTPAPQGAAAALALVKLARLLPACLAAPAGADAAVRAARLGLLSIPAEDIKAASYGGAVSLIQVAAVEVPLEDAPDARIVAFRAAR